MQDRAIEMLNTAPLSKFFAAKEQDIQPLSLLTETQLLSKRILFGTCRLPTIAAVQIFDFAKDLVIYSKDINGQNAFEIDSFGS
jgi:hypothetical protein